jgi:hypothetical protein
VLHRGITTARYQSRAERGAGSCTRREASASRRPDRYVRKLPSMSEDARADQLTTELLAIWKAHILGQVGLLRTLCASGVLAPDQAVDWLDEFARNLDPDSTLAEDFVRPVIAEARNAFGRVSQ